jgi:hypothetical protein
MRPHFFLSFHCTHKMCERGMYFSQGDLLATLMDISKLGEIATTAISRLACDQEASSLSFGLYNRVRDSPGKT